jgi:hypothetical protein
MLIWNYEMLIASRPFTTPRQKIFVRTGWALALALGYGVS